MLELLKYKQKVILFIAIVLLIIFVSLVYIFITSRENLISAHQERLESTSKLTINILKKDIQNVQKVINLFKENQTLAEYLYITNILGYEHDLLEELEKNIIHPLDFSLLALYDGNGNEVLHIDIGSKEMKVSGQPLKNLSLLKENKVISGFTMNKGLVRLLSVGAVTQKKSLFPENIISYVKIGANIDINTLQSIKEMSGDDLFIVKGNDVLLSTQKGISSLEISGPEMEVAGMMYSIKSLPLTSIYGREIGRLVIALSQKDLMTALKDLQLFMLFIALGCITVSVFMGFILIKTLTNPLNRLVKLTEQVGRGSFPEDKTFGGSDEVSVLGRHFLEMTKKLKDQKKALDSYTTGLEDAVMERTHELYKSKEEWVRTFNSISDYVVILDKDQQIVRANKALLDKLDLTNQEVAGKKCYEIFCGGKRTHDDCPIMESLTTGQPCIQEIRYDKLAGLFIATASPLVGEKDDITGTVYIVKDITERHNIQLQMMNAEKLASLGQMAAGFAHEINNPMASIAGCSELMIDRLHEEDMRKIPDYEYFHDYLNIIFKEAFRCKDIIGGMLKFSRKGFERGVVYISPILHEIPLILDHLTKTQRIEVKEDYASKTDSIQADEGEIRQVLLALIVNAMDSMPDGGLLTLKTWDSDGNIHIAIQDSGAGIPPEARRHIFEPFFTTKPVGKGTGLGLFIAFNIVKNNQGKLELKSSGEKGTVFTLTFPIETAPTPEPQ